MNFSNILDALGSTELKGEIPHPTDNSPKKPFLKPGGVFGVVAAAVKTEIGLCVL